MWHVFCPGCGHHVLVGTRGICEIINQAPGDIVVVLRCPFGHRIAVRTGAYNPSPSSTSRLPPAR